MIKIGHTLRKDSRGRIYTVKGKYLRDASNVLCYGAGITSTAKVTKLGLRRTNVLHKELTKHDILFH